MTPRTKALSFGTLCLLVASIASAQSPAPAPAQNTGQSSCKPGVEDITWNDADGKPQHAWGVAGDPLKVAGRYLYEGNDHPWVLLDGNSTGLYEMHGAPKPEYQYHIVRWWVQANCDGSFPKETGERGASYAIITRFDRNYQGTDVSISSLTVLNDGRRFIDGERVLVSP